MITPSFTHTHTIETDVPVEAIWSLYEDVTTWPSWDAQAELITREGPFVAGSTGTMKFAGQDPLPYRLVTVEPLREFTDEIPVGDLVVRVSHQLERVDPSRLSITYSLEIDGPGDQARQLGPIIIADFPATMASLLALAKERSA